MIIRAILLSLLLHGAVLLTLARLEMSAPQARAGLPAPALPAVLGWHREPPSRDPSPAQAVAPAATGNPSGRQDRQALSGSRAASPGRDASSAAGAGTVADGEAQPLPAEATDDLSPVTVEALGQYRLTVARHARAFKAYPELARENRWAGVVLVSVALPPVPGQPNVSLARSSGHEVLDRQALDMLEKAVKLAELPAGLRGRTLIITLPVEYRQVD